MRSGADGAKQDEAPSNRYGARLAGLLRRRASGLAAFVALLIAFDATQSWSESGWLRIGEQPEIILRFTGVLTLTAAIGPLLVEATTLRGWRRILLDTVATFALVGLAAIAEGILNGNWYAANIRAGDTYFFHSFLVRSWWLYSVAGLFFAAFCHSRERKLATIRAAQLAEIERAETQRNIVESRLKVLQARVEPEMLFDTLAEVRASYRRDPEAAGDLLDDLIGYLRAALPQMRSGSSTVAREVALANAYLRVLHAGRGKGWSMSTQIDDGTAAAPFPPMVLLPMVLAACEGSSAAILISSSSTRAEAGEVLRFVAIEVAAPVRPSGWEEGRLAMVRGTLQQFLGDGATLRAETSAGTVRVVLTWTERAPTIVPLPDFGVTQQMQPPVVAVDAGLANGG